MKIHHLKTVDPYFTKVWNKTKLFEVRFNDRNFETGDRVILKEYNLINNTYSGKKITGTIGFVLKNYPDVKENYVVFSLTDLKNWLPCMD